MKLTHRAAKRQSALVALLAIAWLYGMLATVEAQPPGSAAATTGQAADAKKSDATSTGADSKPESLRQGIERIRSMSFADLVDWLRLHGVSVVLIIVLATAILWLANRLQRRLVLLWAGQTTRGTAAEQENRARTLVGVLHNALRTAVVAVAAIMVLEEIGVKVGALLGGVAVAGLAIAFGAQSLIKDYFTGFLVLLEQQYLIGDVVRIGAITGQVEQVTLRLTVLRDLEGAVHFIPHGQINLVTNLTHGWSQAVFELNVPRGESVERIRDLFFELAREARSDANIGPMILNDAAMLGVESLGDSTFTVKFTLKTLPLKRWEVKRELLRRIKDRFQEEQIKVSIPA
jgi:moderate conductance mechanosensitive channel